ncbi:hypothetical protein [Mycolicibacterium fortuitum]|uniref:hypothetical protein n=1 Tax=Mycolicibacterium fortuitum TaxID=1766 RepID=UPI00096F4ACA|nr:hypothetical protein [Mycolicibacterium fortuitum]
MPGCYAAGPIRSRLQHHFPSGTALFQLGDRRPDIVERLYPGETLCAGSTQPVHLQGPGPIPAAAARRMTPTGAVYRSTAPPVSRGLRVMTREIHIVVNKGAAQLPFTLGEAQRRASREQTRPRQG